MNVLFSYWHMNEHVCRFIEEAGEDGARVMMDSGAYSVFMAGASITLGEYMAVCKRLEPHLFSYIMLDVLRDRMATRDNYERFLEKGLTPMPVWTMDGHVDDLEFYKALRPEAKFCVAGGTVEKMAWLGPRFQVAREVLGEDTFIHGLGFTAKHALGQPVDSVDSSSYKEAGRFGTLSVFTPEMGMKRFQIGTLAKKGFAALPTWAQECIVRSGLPENLGKVKQKGMYSSMYLLGLSAWLDFAQEAKRHGIRLFFAVRSEHELCPLALVAMHKDQNGHIDWQSVQSEREALHNAVREDPDEFAIYFKEASCRQGLLW